MSPASAGVLEVERYIGACLITQDRSKNPSKNRDFFQRPHVYPQNGYVNLQGCPPVDGWAGGVPLISFAGHSRRMRQDHDDVSNSHLARLAVHTQGVPLILAKSYNHRKNKPQRNSSINSNNAVQQTKIFENSNNRKQSKSQETVNSGGSGTGVDTVSVTSDESSCSQNSETCLPRIIKPRKRRKKDRKPPHLSRPQNQDGFSTDSVSPDIEATSLATLSPYLPCFEPFNSYPSSLLPDDNKQLFDLLGDISETPKLHHSFEDVEEAKDVNGNQPASTCQCRYCDPAGQIWDVDRSCYSPFLTPPKTFNFPSLLNGSTPFSSPPSDYYGLLHSMSSISLEEDKYKPSFSRSASSSSTSSSSSIGDLEVSTEIVTSLNGHRDLEIKFWLSSAVDSKSTKEKVSNQLVCNKM